MPSALSTSSAYSISRKEPSVSGSGITANRPKRPGWLRTSSAPYSLTLRAVGRFFRIAEPDAGRRERQHRGFDTVFIHRGERLLRRPFEPRPADLAAPRARD